VFARTSEEPAKAAATLFLFLSLYMNARKDLQPTHRRIRTLMWNK